MASTSRRGARRANESHSQSRVAQSQSEPQHDTIDHQVRAVLNFILCHSSNKVPVKMSDLMTLASGKNELAKRLPFVTQLLEERYGIKLVLLEGAPKRYICLAESPMMSIYELKASQRPQYTMLYIILTYIFLRGNRIEEDKLYGMLDALNVNVHEEHGYFGDNISKLIEDTFVKQQYLKRERSQLSPYDDPKNYYSWGSRAKSEFTYQQIVQFASKLFDQDASFFQQQLMMAEGVDNPDMLQHLSVAANQTERSYFDLNDESQNASMEVDSQ
ncbi:non-structural maintenance of chromosomes element 3 homolog [Drosophila innubila]|uniref:non-structural maintenance of chromosomes element 3 homolog n=1 Tax=Drosophila innubila TaxID=198719 RepID=UPI00148C3E0E|nr:non-structural maintenance of chromosomes element 3 homolog [Drosophila innubila]